MNTARKGARVERRARHLLESLGFVVMRSAASKGAVDLLAVDAVSIRAIQVKANGYASAVERERLKLLPLPSNASREIWRFIDRKREPLIERL
jgi:Holliday junction resolvase